ncbi:MAG: hypothetical protein P9L92_00635 [Candidatus Electryonea clarkiae]|nr:hypothetical protein [Candidatus Electryonea clarkiae]MDP8287084.1 hypothetical protein [Candidatus Electryonea clarkiae]
MPKKWTPEDEAYLVANYDKIPIEELARQFGVTKKAVRVKYGKLRDRPDFETIAKHAPDTPPAPSTGTQPRGPRKWSEDDERYLLANYNTQSLDELALHFGVTKKAVRVKYGKIKHKASELVPDKGLSETEQLQVGPRHWTEEDENYLISNYEELGPDALADYFGIPREAVRLKYGKIKEKHHPLLNIPRHFAPPVRPPEDITMKRKPITPLVSMSIPRLFQKRDDKDKDITGSHDTHMMVMTKKGWKPLKIQKKHMTK